MFYHSVGQQNRSTADVFNSFENNFKIINWESASGYHDVQIPDRYAFGKTMAFDDDCIIESEYRDKFIIKNLYASVNRKDNKNIAGFSGFIQSENLNCFYYGKLQHPNSNKVVCLIIAMQNDSASYFVMMYFQSQTGLFLGFDVLAGQNNQVTDTSDTFVSYLKLLPAGLLVQKKLSNDSIDNYVVHILEKKKLTSIYKSKYVPFIREIAESINDAKKHWVMYFSNSAGSIEDNASPSDYRIEYPPDFFIKESHELIESGETSTFKSVDGKSILTLSDNCTSSIFFDYDDITHEKYYLILKEIMEDNGDSITYNTIGKNSFILSGFCKNRGYIFYDKVLFKDNLVIEARIEYPVFQKNIYSAIINRMFSSFK